MNQNSIYGLKGVIAIDLIEALQKQMNFCKNKEKYKCGIYVENPERIKIVANVISNLLPVPNREIKLKLNRYDAGAEWQNGSIIRIMNTSENARWQRFNGVIIDNDIDKEIISCVIMPTIRPIMVFNDESDKEMYERIYTVGVSQDDVEKSKRYITRGLRSNNIIIDDLFFMNKKLFEKEYECMFGTTKFMGMDGHDSAYITKEINNDKVMLFLAMGIPKENITYETEFINKTKQTYLNIKGEFKDEVIGFNNNINIHLRIDTDIYDGYDVFIDNGLVFVRLHEIINEAPVLKDYGVA